jgi:Ca2+-transporting ATPase
MATLHPAERDGTVALVKGAPDRVLAFCTHVLLEGQAVELTDEQRAEIAAANQHLASQALRVVAGAVRSMPPGREALQREDVEQGLIFVACGGWWTRRDRRRSKRWPMPRGPASAW